MCGGVCVGVCVCVCVCVTYLLLYQATRFSSIFLRKKQLSQQCATYAMLRHIYSWTSFEIESKKSAKSKTREPLQISKYRPSGKPPQFKALNYV